MATCIECGNQISRFKTNNGHMDNCPTLPENQPSRGAGRSPKYHDSNWQKNGRLDGQTAWRCRHCGAPRLTNGDKPGPERHQGKPRG